MCRLYGFRATHPTRAACDLLDAQNALILQSSEDVEGRANPDGWGIGVLGEEGVFCRRQVEPASQSAAFRAAALAADGLGIVAHIRRATVGKVSMENTHPFRSDSSLLVHNGTVPAFEQVRPRILEALPTARRGDIRGSTDSEHVFHLLLHRRREAPSAPLHEIVRGVVRDIVAWAAEETGEAAALNLLWIVDGALAGSRLNRSLWRLERPMPYRCGICGRAHADPPEPDRYRIVVLASERITDEVWSEVPEGSVFSVDRALRFTLEPVDG